MTSCHRQIVSIDDPVIEMLPSEQQGSEHKDSDSDKAKPHNIVEEVVGFKDVGSALQTLKKFLE